MKHITYVFLTGIIFLASCGGQQPDNSGPSTGSTQPTVSSGEKLFMANCAACHTMQRDATGPALAGAVSRWGNDTAKMITYIKNPIKSITEAGENSYQGKLYAKWHNVTMPPFSGLTDADILSIIRHFQ